MTKLRISSPIMRPLIVGLIATLANYGTQSRGQTLQEAFAGKFRIGVAVSDAMLLDTDSQARTLVAQQFNSITPENVLKWEKVHPEPNTYSFAAADRFVEFGEQHQMFIVGHTLVWHSQTPKWVFEGQEGEPLSRDEAIARMREHIQTVVGRYRGRVHGWDVVNEALNDDGTLRDSPWRQLIGDEYLELAFRFAREADPEARLYYNDYGLTNARKREGAVRLVRRLLAAGCQVDTIAMQGHSALDYPTIDELQQSIEAFAAVTGSVAVSELDINVLPQPGNYQGADVGRRSERAAKLDPYQQGLPDEVQQQLAQRYADFFRVYLKHADVLDRVTFWGLDDGQTWHNYWPIRGRTAHSLLFDRKFRPKPAFDAVLGVANRK